MKKAQEIVVEGLEAKGLTQTELAKSMGEDVRSLNQQLNRQKDMKVSRFADVMEHIGYEIELSEREYRKVSPEYGRAVAASGSPIGIFWYEEGGRFYAIDSERKPALAVDFSSKDELKRWLNKTLADGRKVGQS